MTYDEMVEFLACYVCGKPQGLPTNECHLSIGRNKPLCNEYHCCRIAEKSDDQLRYTFSSINEDTFLKACPGSGKTEVVGLKAAYEIQRWFKEVGGIAVLSFTNSATDVITQRASQFLGTEKVGYPHFIGTIDSWLHGYIAQPFLHLETGYSAKDGDNSIRIIDENVSDGWINNYQSKTGYHYYRKGKNGEQIIFKIPLYANMIRYDPEFNWWEIRKRGAKHNEFISDSDYFNSPAFTKFRSDKHWLTIDYMRSGFSNTKNHFLKDGFATYQDIEYLSYKLLISKPELSLALSKRFPLIIIDECQDLSWIQLHIFKKLKDSGSTLHFIGDINQSIYEFKKVDPKKVEDFVEDNKFTILTLSDNFRSCQPVVDVCKKIVGEKSPIIGKLEQTLEQPCICVSYQKEQMSMLSKWFKDYLNQNGIDVAKSAIITRSWKNISRLRPSGSNQIKKYQLRLAMAINLWQSKHQQAIDDSLKYIGRFFAEKIFAKYSSNSRHYYCPEFVTSPMRWRLFLSRVLDACSKSNESIFDLSQTWFNWANCIRNHFISLVIECLSSLKDYLTVDILPIKDLDGRNFQVPRNMGNMKVKQTLSPNVEEAAKIKITTIHSIKGQTLDAVLVVSTPSRQTIDGHWTKWLENYESEAARLAYVASSRPRHLLAWAIPEPTEKEKGCIKSMGFSMLN